MRTQTNEVQAIYNNAIRAQRIAGMGKPFFVVITDTDRAALHERARLDIEKIAQAAGVEMLKTARITARRAARQQQEAGLEQLNDMLRKMRETDSKAEAVKWGMVAAGHANGMCCGDLISKSELNDVIGVIDQTYQKAELRIKAAKRPFWARIIRKRVRA
ncbi:MAG: hypothetical protein NC548_22350 [Lachnospiraceae bacterium]|nr:hypothetical protein [Lachnospiraceae bacterium]